MLGFDTGILDYDTHETCTKYPRSSAVHEGSRVPNTAGHGVRVGVAAPLLMYCGSLLKFPHTKGA